MSQQNRAVPSPDVVPVLTVEQTGEILGISRTSAYQAVERGEIPVVRIGRRIMVPTAQLRRMLGLDERVQPAA